MMNVTGGDFRFKHAVLRRRMFGGPSHLHLFNSAFGDARVELKDIVAAKIVAYLPPNGAGRLVCTALGALALGAPGALAGLMLGGSKQQVVARFALHDGRSMLLQGTQKEVNELISAATSR